MIKIGQRWTNGDGVTLTISSVSPNIVITADNGEFETIKNPQGLPLKEFIEAFERGLENQSFELEPDVVQIGSRLDDID